MTVPFERATGFTPGGQQELSPELPVATLGEGEPDPVSRVLATHAGLAAAPFYADLFGVGAQQVDRLEVEDVEMILGQDARFYLAAQTAEGG